VVLRRFDNDIVFEEMN